jgi:hypothetical protein
MLLLPAVTQSTHGTQSRVLDFCFVVAASPFRWLFDRKATTATDQSAVSVSVRAEKQRKGCDHMTGTSIQGKEETGGRHSALATVRSQQALRAPVRMPSLGFPASQRIVAAWKLE